MSDGESDEEGSWGYKICLGTCLAKVWYNDNERGTGTPKGPVNRV